MTSNLADMKPLTANAIIYESLAIGQKQFIRETIERIGGATMTPTSHGYDNSRSESILTAAVRDAKDYTLHSRSSPAVAIMGVILAAHRAYNKAVEKYVRQMRSEYAGLTIKGLDQLVREKYTAEGFKAVWGHKDERKFGVLKDVLAVIVSRLGTIDTVEHDYQVMSVWAADADLSRRLLDPIGGIMHIGVATFQHLRMTFGVDTVKPDQRVKDVLEREFGLRSYDDLKVIMIMEKLAKLEGVGPLLLDQIFVKYGSGHYTAESDVLRTTVETIIRKLKAAGVSHAVIANATGWTNVDIAQVKEAQT